MKKIVVVFVAALILFGACAKPYYQTNIGKKKQRFYNDIQYGKNAHPKKNW